MTTGQAVVTEKQFQATVREDPLKMPEIGDWVCVCNSCGQLWEGLYVELNGECEACAGLVFDWATEDEATAIAGRFAKQVARYEAETQP